MNTVGSVSPEEAFLSQSAVCRGIRMLAKEVADMNGCACVQRAVMKAKSEELDCSTANAEDVMNDLSQDIKSTLEVSFPALECRLICGSCTDVPMLMGCLLQHVIHCLPRMPNNCQMRRHPCRKHYYRLPAETFYLAQVIHMTCFIKDHPCIPYGWQHCCRTWHQDG